MYTGAKFYSDFLDRMHQSCDNRPARQAAPMEGGEQVFINIEIERLRRHMTRPQMAKELSVSVETLCDWVNKKRAIPAEGLRALSRLFRGCSLDYLLKERG